MRGREEDFCCFGGKLNEFEIFHQQHQYHSADQQEQEQQESHLNTVTPLSVTYVVMWSFFCIGSVLQMGPIYRSVMRLKILDDEEEQEEENNEKLKKE